VTAARAWLWPALAALLFATSAYAGGVEDGNAGLDAFNNGDYDQAIACFTGALRPGELTGGDREFAYVNRGKAYAAKGDFVHAIADFKLALKLQPDDADAQSGLQAALQRQAPTPPAPAEDVAAGGDPWGLLSAMAGQQYYWYEVPGHDPHLAYERLNWVVPQQALSLQVRNKSDQVAVSEYKLLDAKSGLIIYAGLSNEVPEYGTAKAGPQAITATTFVADKPTRYLVKRQPDGSIREVAQSYSGGAWVPGASVVLVPTTVDELTAAGLIKAKKR
jgi:tetratricopeptide (TPR) repeat protein